MSKKIRPENDIEKLTNQQFILLTFLVAIISAITASIAVIRFYERNPNIITRIINEKETLNARKNYWNTPVNKTIMINESDLIANAITKNSKFIFDVVLKEDGKEKIVSKGFKKNGQIFTKKFKINKDSKVFMNSFELIKVTEVDNIMIFKEINNGNNILEIKSDIGKMKLGSTVIDIFSKTYMKKGLIIQKIDDNKFMTDLNIENNDISLVVGLSGKVFGVSSGKYVYPFNYLSRKEG